MTCRTSAATERLDGSLRSAVGGRVGRSYPTRFAHPTPAGDSPRITRRAPAENACISPTARGPRPRSAWVSDPTGTIAGEVPGTISGHENRRTLP